MTSEGKAHFSISGLGSGFADRQRDLFACLDAADKEREHTQPQQPPPLPVDDDVDVDVQVDRRGAGRHSAGPHPDRRKRPPTKQFRGKESIFKRPEMPAPRRARPSMPDYQRNPHKYTKYSLGDVSSEDMSDQSNTATALSFLRELRARKEEEEGDDGIDVDEPSKRAIVFKSARQRVEMRTSSLGAVSTVTTSSTSDEADRPSFRNSKVVMPEYVVGQKVAKKKPGVSGKQSEGQRKAKEIMLGHLVDEDDD